MSRQVNSESILPNDISPSLTNSTDISNNNNINNNNTSSNDNNNDSSKNNSNSSNNNNQNTSNYNGNDNQPRTMPEVVVNGPTTKKDDYDIDDEVMGFMHAYIQSSSPSDAVDNMSSSKGETSKPKGSWPGFSRVLLAQKVAEAFVANKPDSSPTDGPSSSSYNSMNDNMPSWDAPLMSARDNALAPDDYK